MEIRIYQSMDHYRSNKTLYVGRVNCLDAFNFSHTIDVFRCIYGPNIVVVFICL